jgi:thiol-disulfide isomerase/thioredoxin
MLAGCDRQSGEAAQPQPSEAAGKAQVGTIDRSRKGSEMPDFTFADTAGKTLQLKELRGKPVLINLWATWCAPCVAELPALDRMAQAGVIRVVTISQDMGQTEKVGAFLKQRGVTRLEPWLDPKSDLAFHYGAMPLPISVLYGSDGREIWRISGPLEWDEPDARKLVTEAS